MAWPVPTFHTVLLLLFSNTPSLAFHDRCYYQLLPERQLYGCCCCCLASAPALLQINPLPILPLTTCC
jgi:hypothetical protein